MSEYEYNAVRVVVRALTPAQLEALHALSTRAWMTPTCFVNRGTRITVPQAPTRR